MRQSIKIINAALDEIEGGTIVLRGVLSADSLEHIKVDDYQRDVRPITSLKGLISAYAAGNRVPDVDVGMRGQRYTERDGAFYLHDPVYIIDGLQRVSAGVQGMRSGIYTAPHIGCTLHFSTTKEWERARFQILNANRSKVSPNVLLRNLREDSDGIAMIYNLCRDNSFALTGKVSWSQKMNRGELITARTFIGVGLRLHRAFGSGSLTGSPEMVAAAVDKTMRAVGRTIMRDNLRTFIDLLDSAWGIKRIAYRETATYIKGGFLMALAQVLSDHETFWKDPDSKRLFIPAPLVRKISTFPIDDPTVTSLTGGGGNSSSDMLYQLMLRHINSGKRLHHLKRRKGVDSIQDSTDMEQLMNDEECVAA